MSVDKSFERRKGTRKIPVEDVATLVRMGMGLRDAVDELRRDGSTGLVELLSYAAELDLIVQRCGGSPYESEEKEA